MSSIVVAGDTSGSITLAAPAVAGSNTLTLPAATGTVLTSVSAQSAFPPNIAGNGPAFSAYNAGTQSISANTSTKVTFNAKNYDTNSNFDATTNYRFTPTVAGYYQLNVSLYESGFAGALFWLGIAKNGTVIQELYRTTATGQATMNGSTLVSANGSTDYFEVYVYSSGGTMTLGASASQYMNFNGFLARSA